MLCLLYTEQETTQKGTLIYKDTLRDPTVE